mmetsp:Transcript_45386/g.102779  ORF Transcript_45386/g.102779 Transcript_45386/m.102779 type:complete len:218 (-) Transcript_45386:646-1299(-)
MSRWMPSNNKASCNRRGATNPPQSTSILSKISWSCEGESECKPSSPLITGSKSFITWTVSSSTRETRAEPRTTEPMLSWQSTTSQPFCKATACVQVSLGRRASERCSMPATRPVGIRMIRSISGVAWAVLLRFWSTRAAQSSKSSPPGAGGMNFPSTHFQLGRSTRLAIKRAVKGEFRTRRPLLKSAAPKLCPTVQIRTKWFRQICASALSPQTSSW